MRQRDDDWDRLASYVISARLAAGMRTRGDLSAACGVTARTLGKLETGRPVSAETLAAVAAAVGWSPDSPRRILRGGTPQRNGGGNEAEQSALDPLNYPPGPLRRILEDPDLGDDEKLAMITAAELIRARRGGASQADEERRA